MQVDEYTLPAFRSSDVYAMADGEAPNKGYDEGRVVPLADILTDTRRKRRSCGGYPWSHDARFKQTLAEVALAVLSTV